MVALLARKASCSFASNSVLGSASKIAVSCCFTGDMMVVRMGGKVDVNRIGESDTRNDEDVVANEVTACHTGV